MLDGARQILMERFSENAQLVGKLRNYVARQGAVKAEVVSGKEQEGAKFSDYFGYSENWKNIPSIVRWRCCVVVMKAFWRWT